MLGSCWIELGRWSEAEAAIVECSEIRERLFPAEGWANAQARSLLGTVRLGQGQLDQARSLLVESAERLLAATDVPAPRVGQPDRVAEAAERAAKLFDALDARDPGAGHAQSAATWRERARARSAASL
jgi:hypothetical protein